MAELENVKEAEAKAVAKKKLKAQVVSKVDTTPASVVKWVQEGRELYFAGGEDFMELPTEVAALLTGLSAQRYAIERDAKNGVDVVGNATNAINGFELNFNVRPDDPNRQLTVHGKDPKMVYHWARPDKYEQHLREGWVVDHDPNTSTEYDESCSYKTVGGQSQPELLLLKKSKEAHTDNQVKRKERRDGLVKKTQENFRRDVESIGGKAVVQSDNG